MKQILQLAAIAVLMSSCSSKADREKEIQALMDSVIANSAEIAANAPADSVRIAAGTEIKDLQQQIDSVSAEARKTLPGAKSRFFKGLGKGEAFFLTLNLKEGNTVERVFIRVTKWKEKNIAGIISNDIVGLSTYKNGQEITFTEDEVVDWTITKPDGSEEGNYIGKFMDHM